VSKWNKEINGENFISNGKFYPLAKFPFHRISSKRVIYEVVRLINGKALFLKEHFLRLRLSFSLLKTDFPFEYQEISNTLTQLIKKEGFKNQNIKLLFILGDGTVDFLAYFIQSHYPNPELYRKGVKTDFYFQGRTNPNIKAIMLDWRKGVEQFIAENNLFEAILVDDNGYITEGSRSNLFFVKKNILFTSPEKAVLPGITRKKVFDIAKENKIEIVQAAIPYTNAGEFEAAFITGTSPQILPLKKIGNISFEPENKLIHFLIHQYDLKILSDIDSNH